jgi:hypothetical protein
LYVLDNVTQAAGCDFKENLNSPTVFIKKILRCVVRHLLFKIAPRRLRLAPLLKKLWKKATLLTATWYK